MKGGEAHTTNNRMELMAAISALEALKKPCTVDLYTDSQYVRQGITGWIHGWKKNGWRTSDKKPVKNVDLWQRLDAALHQHQVRWHWVKGHAGHDENERADQLAREGVAMARLKTVAGGSVGGLTHRETRRLRRRWVSLRSTHPTALPTVVIARSEATKQSTSHAAPWIASRACRRAALRTNPLARNDGVTYSCPSSVSPPETSTLPGAGSRLSFFTTPSSTSIE